MAPDSMTLGLAIDIFGLFVLIIFFALVAFGIAFSIAVWIRERLEKHAGYRFSLEFNWSEIKADSEGTSGGNGE